MTLASRCVFLKAYKSAATPTGREGGDGRYAGYQGRVLRVIVVRPCAK